MMPINNTSTALVFRETRDKNSMFKKSFLMRSSTLAFSFPSAPNSGQISAKLVEKLTLIVKVLTERGTALLGF
jgi:hypothetical protein